MWYKRHKTLRGISFFLDEEMNRWVEEEWNRVAALLAEAWLVMNNPICVSLLLKPLVLQAHTAESVTDPL